MDEVVPGIFRVESVLGPRPFSQWLLRDERALLVDSGMAYTPVDVILPALGEVRVDWLLVSHADVDHHGGNAALRDAFPGLEILAGAADIPLIESAETILRDRYGWYDEHGIGYPDDVKQWLRDGLGPDTPVDLGLAGGEELRLGPRLRVRVLHLPGHTAGHLGLWHEESRTAIVQDAVMANGLLDTHGNVVHPPPVPHVEDYERSVRALQELRPERLLTAHYHPIEGAAVGRFLDDSLEFVERAREVVAEHGDLPLAELLAVADERLGPFTSMPNELATTLRALGKETAWSSA
jgi:glyoxylase-like metal-dependent hydrolase (beta-lactamase superfamily II)